MTPIAIEFAIQSRYQNQRFQTAGHRHGDTIEFVDPDGNHHILASSMDVLTYRRFGDATLEFSFDPKNETMGTYHVLGHTMTFTIRTLHVRHHTDRIHVVYALYQNGEEIGQTEIILRHHPMKEE
jgi:uncharacterized beta-barrel protein YwiB (DUF1934 family)